MGWGIIQDYWLKRRYGRMDSKCSDELEFMSSWNVDYKPHYIIVMQDHFAGCRTASELILPPAPSSQALEAADLINASVPRYIDTSNPPPPPMSNYRFFLREIHTAFFRYLPLDLNLTRDSSNHEQLSIWQYHPAERETLCPINHSSPLFLRMISRLHSCPFLYISFLIRSSWPSMHRRKHWVRGAARTRAPPQKSSRRNFELLTNNLISLITKCPPPPPVFRPSLRLCFNVTSMTVFWPQ